MSSPLEFNRVYSFTSSSGVAPRANLTPYGGLLYGTTSGGGAYGAGTVFALSPSGQAEVIHNFAGGSDGSTPVASLIVLGNVLYGTTSVGGSSGAGTVFSITPQGQERILYSFKGGSDGSYPQAGLVSANGYLYGVTAGGGYGAGTIYRISLTTGQENVVYSFDANSSELDGSSPSTTLIVVGYTLYGTTNSGGQFGKGMVFAISPYDWMPEWTVYNFGAKRYDGETPAGSLIEANGFLYGLTLGGGAHGRGTLYRVSESGEEGIVHSFDSADGAYPTGSLVLAGAYLYGSTQSGGPFNQGVLFQAGLSRGEQVIYAFNGNQGSSPISGLSSVSGLAYGTTLAGGNSSSCGSSGCGTVFSLSVGGGGGKLGGSRLR
jgi:uncharacterized repeat protein (TIGR03803 family)